MIWRICGWSDGLKLNGGEVHYWSTWSNVCYLFSVLRIAFRLLFKCGSLWGLFWLDDARLYPDKFLGGKQGDFFGDGSGIRVLSKGSENHFPPQSPWYLQKVFWKIKIVDYLYAYVFIFTSTWRHFWKNHFS